jgi:hypothetical protein
MNNVKRAEIKNSETQDQGLNPSFSLTDAFAALFGTFLLLIDSAAGR